MAEKDIMDELDETQGSEPGMESSNDTSGSDSIDAATTQLKSDLQETKDKYLRLVAEFDNFRRRSGKERLELIQTAGKEVITEMIGVLDDADRAQKQFELTEDAAQVKEGVTLVFNKFRNILLSRGLKAMETVGKEFDPELHEAIAEIPAPKPDQVGKVSAEVEKGYYLNDKIIRHAKVVVGK